MAYSRKRTYKKKAPMRRRKAARRTKSTFTIKKAVKQVMARQVEVKTRQSEILSQPLVPVANTSDFDATIVPVSFTATAIGVAQGSGQGERIGNRITCKSLMLKAIFVPTPYNATTNPTPLPMQIRCVIFYDKEAPTTVPSPASLGDIFQFGNTSQGFQDDLLDMVLPFNTDRYRICAQKTFKLGYANYGGTGSLAGSQFFANNDFKYNCQWNVQLAKFLPKTVKYNDNDQDSITHQLYMMLIPTLATGGAFSGTVRPATVQYTLSAKYTDL